MTTLPAEMIVPHFSGNRRIGTITKPVPAPGPGQLLLQVKANALCGSERGQFFNGSAITPGHEAAGVVVAAGLNTNMDEILKAFREGKEPPIHASWGQRILQLAFAAIESYKSGQRIQIATEN
jgi:D-arabinose 1-dehydrogenase-like Zn-dependent alcohol dehydrogenase